MTTGTRPAEALSGAQLDNGWTVGSQFVSGPGATGGTFSVTYEVHRAHAGQQQRAFLKALDLTAAFGMPESLVDSLQVLTKAYIFERDLVLECARKRMSNVVVGLDAGHYTVDDTLFDPTYKIVGEVPYIIFEIADGDVRQRVSAGLGVVDDAWKLRVMHGATNGLRQLHRATVAHQDIKPSNVMTFSDVGKLGDLGRASQQGVGPANDEPVAGDRTYAPPELLYGELNQDDEARRRAADVYQIGSLLVFLFSGSGLTSLIEAELDAAFHWRTWPRDYRNVLPYVRDAFDRVMVTFEPALPDKVRAEALAMIRELSDPDPHLRGNPRASSATSRYALERFVSRFDRLARTLELELTRRGL